MAPDEPDSNIFSIRIVSLDYYMAPPIPDLDFCYSDFQGQSVAEVPVIRIYGSTLAGQKTCLHIHRVLPYVYVPCSDISPQITQEGRAHEYMDRVTSAIESAMKFKGSVGCKRQHVHSCKLVRARRFYGYHSSEELFVKIYLYYPHEVARAATLLLGGGVLNQCFQPHESHIPYLLQFLVDYNLYGMGHLHLSKVKFRLPLPEDFIPRTVRFNNQFRHGRGNSVRASDSSEAKSSGAVGRHPLIWLSSTVPSDWKWGFPVTKNVDGSLDGGIQLIKRQSICELEGDADVDGILNQEHKTYITLSQAGPDMKMVHSLIPIWEEEYARAGMPGNTEARNICKPSPENVLRTLSHGMELENALFDLFNKVHGTISLNLTPSKDGKKLVQYAIPSSKICGCLAGGEHVNSCNANSEYSQFPKEENSTGGEHVNSCNANSEYSQFPKEENSTALVLPLASLGVEDAIHPELVSEPAGLMPTNAEFAPSEIPRTKDSKVVDVEALGLLRWLASSQAVEDISTDDELVHEVVLSPLLPTTTIEKVLEKAHLDYESESQKECQDILDSVEDALKSENLKEHTAYFESDAHMHLAGISSKDAIPQVDGLWDEKPTTHHSGNSSENKMSSELVKNSPCQLLGDTTAGVSCEPKRNQSLWGILPLSSKEEVHKDLESTHRMPMGVCTQGMKSFADASSSAVNEVERSYDTSIIGAASMSPGLKEGKNLMGYSVRDLMRRKRCYRVETSEHGNHGVKKAVSRWESNDGESFSSPEQIDSHFVGNYANATRSSEAPHFKSSPVEACAARCKPGTCSEAYGLGPSSCDIHSYQALPFSALDKSKMHAHMVERFDQNEEHQLLDENEENKLIVGSSCLIPVPADDPCLHGIDNNYKNNQVDSSEKGGLPEVPFNIHAKTGVSVASGVLHVENDNSIVLVSETCTSEPGRALNEVLSMAKFSSEYMEMTFNLKPPTVEQASKDFEDASLQSARHNVVYQGNMEIDSLASTSSLLNWKNVDNFLPFFTNDPHGGNEVHEKHYKYNEDSSFHQETVLGVPTYYQNDGSILFLLTPVFSPPSFACVRQWLLQLPEQDRMNEATGILREKLPMALEFTKPTFLNDSEDFIHMNEEYKCSQYGETLGEPRDIHAAMSDDLVNTQVFEEDACKETFPCSGNSPHAKPMIDQLRQEIHGSTKAGREVNHADAETKPLSKGICGQEKGWREHCQEISQISGPSGRSKLTPLSQIGFRDPVNVGAGQQLTLLSIEVLAESRGHLRPDPRYDAINVIAMAVQEDTDHALEVCVLLRGNAGDLCQRNLDGISGCKVVTVTGEKDLFDLFVKLVCSLDPDILMGWEIQGASLGFLAERAAHLGIGLLKNISRTPMSESIPQGDSVDTENHMLNNILHEGLIADAIIEDEWGRTHNSGIHVGGRIVLNIWRIMRTELKLNMYTLEAVAEAVLRRKIPYIPFRILSQWFSSGPGFARFRCIEYGMDRAKLNLEIMNQLDMINRTSELARVFGIDFFSVLSRGSQYRVESMLLRLAHTQNYLVLSPSSQQVASQPAMECLPLVMEPESGFYTDPVVVLDFQSLYPSMIIAYNLCFCTCLGKVVPAKANVLGVSSFAPEPQILLDLKHQILLTPNGVMYVPSKVRKGVLPRLLEELLSTRIMVKQAIKKLKTSQRVLHRIFNARQLALKLISNVTYGYTAAGFSGRMPCAELADSIVQCGRRTLEKAISFVNAHEEWNARVIYGDTDSMFVLLKGRTREESFRIGHEIASTITALNPYPVTLKMEKVYHPCFLLTKKRYVGYSFESSDQDKPIFDAKGIETVRRDTCPAVAKTLEQSLRILFECQDISRIKLYLQRQWTRILRGKLSLQDFVFAKEVRLGTYSARSYSLPPAAIVSTKAMRADPRAEPRYGERIPYVVIHGEPGARLVDMVVDPLDVLEINSPYRLNDLYYINKQIIPALQRVFGLVGVDLNKWFSEMPRPVRPTLAKRHLYVSNQGFTCGVDGELGIGKKAQAHRTRIDSYYLSRHCTLCEELVQASSYLCDKCSKKGYIAAAVMVGKTSKLERDILHLAAICRHCGGGDWIVESGVKCVSLACPIFYERRKVQKELQALSNVAAEMGFYPRCAAEWF